jgi:hypothetical protein
MAKYLVPAVLAALCVRFASMLLFGSASVFAWSQEARRSRVLSRELAAAEAKAALLAARVKGIENENSPSMDMLETYAIDKLHRVPKGYKVLID